MRDIMPSINAWLAQEKTIALATVTQTWGSGPRRAGAKMAVTTELAMIGSVSGGCVEGAVIEAAMTSLKAQQPHLLSFGIADDTAWEVGLTCGGEISVFVEPLDQAWWWALSARINADDAATTITLLDGERAGEKVLFDAAGNWLYRTAQMDDEAVTALRAVARSAAQSGQQVWHDTPIMVDVYRPRPHLIIIGGVHVAIPLQAMAQTLGFRVSIVDPRSAFASSERFPTVETISHAYPDKALPELGLNHNTYLAVLTHDPKIDDAALIAALPTPVPYIGVLSSSRTHAKRVARLRAAGLSDTLIGRIRTPIGLDIGSRDPAEIALGIMAEIIAVRNGKRDTITS